MELRTVANGADLDTVRDLFREYEAQIGVDLCFQNFTAELAGLPGEYAPPTGTLLVAVENGAIAGCVAAHRWDATSCEMKRLFVRPGFQGCGMGRGLTNAVITWARDHGYGRVLLDTLPSMRSAQRMYEHLGFRDTEPYRPNPVEGTRYMALTL